LYRQLTCFLMKGKHLLNWKDELIFGISSPFCPVTIGWIQVFQIINMWKSQLSKCRKFHISKAYFTVFLKAFQKLIHIDTKFQIRCSTKAAMHVNWKWGSFHAQKRSAELNSVVYMCVYSKRFRLHESSQVTLSVVNTMDNVHTVPITLKYILYFIPWFIFHHYL